MTANTDFIGLIALAIAVFLCLFVLQSRHDALARRVGMMEALHRQDDEDHQ